MGAFVTDMRPVVLKLDNVTKSFSATRGGQSVDAVSNVTLEVFEGEILTLVGPSGCGKTTVLSMLAGFEMPTSGTITMHSRPVLGPGCERGMLFQEYALFPWRTVAQNIEFGLRYGPNHYAKSDREDIVHHHIAMVGLEGAESKYPHELSGGMRQRCALARLLAYDPEVLLMDEPLAALDAQTRIILQEELLRIWRQGGAESRKTIVYVTHSIDEAVFLSDRVGVLSSSPGQLREIVMIDLPRPRDSTSRALARTQELESQIWDLIRDEAFQAVRGEK